MTCSCIIDPDTTFATMWDMFSLSLLLYVSVAVPFRACFGVMIIPYGGIWWFDLVIDVYFYLDIMCVVPRAAVPQRSPALCAPADTTSGWRTGTRAACGSPTRATSPRTT